MVDDNSNKGPKNKSRILRFINDKKEESNRRFRASPEGVIDDTKELASATTISIGEPEESIMPKSIVLGEDGTKHKKDAQGEGFVPSLTTLQELFNESTTIEVGPDHPDNKHLTAISEMQQLANPTSFHRVLEELRTGEIIKDTDPRDITQDSVDEDSVESDFFDSANKSVEIRTRLAENRGENPYEFDMRLNRFKDGLIDSGEARVEELYDGLELPTGGYPTVTPEELMARQQSGRIQTEKMNALPAAEFGKDEDTEEGTDVIPFKGLNRLESKTFRGNPEDNRSLNQQEIPGAEFVAIQGDEQSIPRVDPLHDRDYLKFIDTLEDLEPKPITDSNGFPKVEAIDIPLPKTELERRLSQEEKGERKFGIPRIKSNVKKTKSNLVSKVLLIAATIGLTLGVNHTYNQPKEDFEEQIGDDDVPGIDNFDEGYETGSVISAQLTDRTEVTYEPITPDLDAQAAIIFPPQEEPDSYEPQESFRSVETFEESEDPAYVTPVEENEEPQESEDPAYEQSLEENLLSTEQEDITIDDEPQTNVIVRAEQPEQLEIIQNKDDIYQTIKVEKGQTLSKIASSITGDESYSSAANRTLMQHIKRKNNIKDINLIFAGDKLVVPQSWESYEVQKDDILSRIVEDYNGTAQDNEIENPDFILTGQKIYVPKQKVEEKVEEKFLGGDSFAINSMYQDILESRIDLIARKEEEYEEFLQDPINNQQFSEDTKLEEIFKFYRDTGATLESISETYEQRLASAASTACNENIVGLEKATWSEILDMYNLESKDLRKVREKMSCSKTEAYQGFMEQRAYEVQEAKARGESVQDIAKDFNISSTTVYRDLKRNPLKRTEQNLMDDVNFNLLEIPESQIKGDYDTDGNLEIKTYERPLEERIFDDLGYNTSKALSNYQAA
ncbi:MAG: LysM peptidoglycan-binding domain-containing protein [archaeon]